MDSRGEVKRMGREMLLLLTVLRADSLLLVNYLIVFQFQHDGSVDVIRLVLPTLSNILKYLLRCT